jgi:hypothetical protein
MIAVACAGVVAGTAHAVVTAADPYARSLVPDHETVALLSAGDTVPLTGNPAGAYRMVGIPDGLGAHRNRDGGATVFMNHELRNTVVSEPVVGGAPRRGAFVSRLVMRRDGTVVSGGPAYDRVYVEDSYVGPAADTTNTIRAFSRFCSGSLAGPAEGFDRNIYLAGEEEGTEANTFDGKGGQAVAIVDGGAHALPALGRFSWENALVQRGTGRRTVIMGMEDGPSDLAPERDNSQLWMYVGATVLERNGLVGGTLYVFRAKDRAVTSEAGFGSGSLRGEWVAVPGASSMTATQLEAAADAAGAMTFARPEDGAFDRTDPDRFFWVTTGGAAGVNALGRVYSLALHRGNPVRDATLTLAVDADRVVAAGGDTALSPDNIDVSRERLVVQEDGTTESRAVMAQKGRDGSIWRFDLTRRGSGVDPASATRVVTLSPPGRDGVPVGPGVWETSGIIDTSGVLGRGTWLFDVQAHPPTAAPAPGTVEDGQLLLLRRR